MGRDNAQYQNYTLSPAREPIAKKKATTGEREIDI